MNRMQRALTAFLFATSFIGAGVAPGQAGDLAAGTYSGSDVPAVEADPASTLRGSLGVPLEDLSLSNSLGKLVFLENGGFALLFGTFACFAAARHHRERLRDKAPLGGWGSGNSLTSI
jgi:hypothetical protein